MQATYHRNTAMPGVLAWGELGDVSHNLPREPLNAARAFWLRAFSPRR